MKVETTPTRRRDPQLRRVRDVLDARDPRRVAEEVRGALVEWRFSWQKSGVRYYVTDRGILLTGSATGTRLLPVWGA